MGVRAEKLNEEFGASSVSRELTPLERPPPHQGVLAASSRRASSCAPLRWQVRLHTRRGVVAPPRGLAIRILIEVSTHVPSMLAEELLGALQPQKVQIGNPKANCGARLLLCDGK